MKIAKIVRKAREQSRLTALDFAVGIFDDFIELHGDRSFRDDGAVLGYGAPERADGCAR